MIYPIQRAGPSFVEQGHLYGHRAFVVVLADAPPNVPAPPEVAYERAVRDFQDSPLTRYQVYLGSPGHARAGERLCQLAQHVKPNADVGLCIHPGDRLRKPYSAVGSILRITRPSIDLDALPPEIGSVSVHAWLGEPVLARIAERVEALHGYFLVLPKEDVGTAKVWLASSGDARWQLVPQHDFNGSAEPAEVEASFHRSQR